MPTLQVTTKTAEQVWSKGDLAIFKLTLDYNGQEVSAKTYSKTISKPGWTGTVESYEKEGRNGSETFVKQPQKEGGYQPQGNSRPASSGGGNKPQGDNFTMYLSYAKDIAVAMYAKDGKLDRDAYAAILDDVNTGGLTLFEAREGASKPTTPAKDELDKVFDGDTEVLEEEETPWTSPEEPPQLPVS